MEPKPRVFFDITIDGIQQDRIGIDLYSNEVPLTAENFRTLCTQDHPISFKDSIFQCFPGFMCKGGDFVSNGTRFWSIYGDKFPDVEVSRRKPMPFDLVTARAVPKIPSKHTGPYPYTCGSQFYICVSPPPWLDNKHVVFGNVTTGRDTVMRMNKVGSPSGITEKVVKVVNCGQIW